MASSHAQYDVHLTKSSSPEEVQQWLTERNFDAKVVERFEGERCYVNIKMDATPK